MQFHFSFLVTALVLGVVTALYEKSQVISSLTREQIREVLQTNGFGSELIEGKDNILRIIISGMRGSLIIGQASLQFYAAASKVGSEDQMLRAVNLWNLEKRFSRSYVDRDGDPVLELDLDLHGGVTYERVEDFLTTVTKSLLAWTMHMSNTPR
jgi:hypothetical protein